MASIEYVTQGRPKGSRNRRTKEIIDRLQARGDLDPIDFLSTIVTNEEEPKELRVQASNVLLPYLHSSGITAHSPCKTLPRYALRARCETYKFCMD
jgi:hypothetical protein